MLTTAKLAKYRRPLYSIESKKNYFFLCYSRTCLLLQHMHRKANQKCSGNRICPTHPLRRIVAKIQFTIHTKIRRFVPKRSYRAGTFRFWQVPWIVYKISLLAKSAMFHQVPGIRKVTFQMPNPKDIETVGTQRAIAIFAFSWFYLPCHSKWRISFYTRIGGPPPPLWLGSGSAPGLNKNYVQAIPTDY